MQSDGAAESALSFSREPSSTGLPVATRCLRWPRIVRVRLQLMEKRMDKAKWVKRWKCWVAATKLPGVWKRKEGGHPLGITNHLLASVAHPVLVTAPCSKRLVTRLPYTATYGALAFARVGSRWPLCGRREASFQALRGVHRVKAARWPNGANGQATDER